jgi:hypothetical protein
MTNILYSREEIVPYSREILKNDLIKHQFNENIVLSILPSVENTLASFKDVYVGRLISEVVDKYLDYNESNNLLDTKIIDSVNDYLTTHSKHLQDIEFSRIRRITGYLVGSLSRFNNAKLSEVNERVKHA